jgi:hypothetical protein
VEVGDVRLPRTSYPIQTSISSSSGKDPRPVYNLFPGIYTPYAHAPADLVKVTAPRLIALPNGSLTGSRDPEYAPEVEPTQQTLDQVQRDSRSFIDRCLAASADKCTPADQGDLYRSSKGYLFEHEVTARTWKLVRYPTIGFTGTWNALDSGVATLATQAGVP